MSGGKGGSTTSEVTVPAYIENAAKANLAKASAISEVGYSPYYGPDVAAFNPMQQAMFQNTSDVANAFGMATPTDPQDIMGNMGRPQTYANGVTGYSSAPMFQDAVDTLGYFRPNQKALMDSFFVNPNAGFDPNSPYVASPGSGVSLNMMGRNPSFSANTTNYGSNSDYYGGNNGGGYGGAVTGYGSGMSPIMTNNPYTSGEAVAPEVIDPAVQDLLAMRRKSRSDENYQRLLDQMSKNNSFGAKLGVQEMQDLADVISPNNYNPRKDTIGNTMTPEQMNNLSQAQRIAQEDIAMNMMGVANMGFMDGVKNVTNIVPTSFKNPSSGRFFGGLMEDGSPRPDNVGGSYGGSLIKGNISNLTGVPSTLANMGAEVISALDFGKGVDFQTAYNKKLADEAYEKALADKLQKTITQIQPAMPSPAQQAVDNRSNEDRQKSANNFTSKQISKNANSSGKVTKESYKGGGF